MRVYSEQEYQAQQRRAQAVRWVAEFLAGVVCGLVILGLIVWGGMK